MLLEISFKMWTDNISDSGVFEEAYLVGNCSNYSRGQEGRSTECDWSVIGWPTLFTFSDQSEVIRAFKTIGL